ncbi:MAG: hypothetical protein KC416_15845, partial [Myxococcales bacterium]|nr:hypothetical protein [Myxococcales bacterium]
VGLARKLGADVVLGLAAGGGLRSEWIHTTDADAALPPDYFQRVSEGEAPGEVGAVTYPFRHRLEGTAAERRALAEYDEYLRYYVAGLAYARSSYAHFSIGSTVAFRASHYAGVRGFPKRAAGEDFHFLNKVAKVARIRSLGGAPLVLSGRCSTRTPFGTGAQVLEGSRSETGRRVMAPAAFNALRTVLSILRKEVDTVQARREVRAAGPWGEAVDGFLEGAAVWDAHGRKGGRVPFWERQLDGLRTLQLLRLLGEAGANPVTLVDARRLAQFRWDHAPQGA